MFKPPTKQTTFLEVPTILIDIFQPNLPNCVTCLLCNLAFCKLEKPVKEDGATEDEEDFSTSLMEV